MSRSVDVRPVPGLIGVLVLSVAAWSQSMAAAERKQQSGIDVEWLGTKDVTTDLDSPLRAGKEPSSPSIRLTEMWRLGDSEDDDVFFEFIRSGASNSSGQGYAVDYQHPAIYVISRDGLLT